MGILVKTSLLTISILLLAGTPLAAVEDAAQRPSQIAAGAESTGEMGPACAGAGKCCGSSACAEAKRKSIQEGKAAVANCPCRKNRAKPDRAVE